MGVLGLGLGFHLLLLLHPALLTGKRTLPTISVSGQEQAPPATVTLPPTDLPTVASSVLAAESWLKSNVLAHFPSTNISTIIVGDGLLCNTHHLLPSVKNLHYSLVRWGLEREIKLSPLLPQDCASDPLLSFLRETGSSYIVHQTKPVTRKMLQFPPLPDGYFSFAPDGSPLVIPDNAPASPPAVIEPPPTVLPGPGPAPCPAPGAGEGKGGLWCVAKPAVPDEKLQEAMDYACGEGGAECEEIGPNGKCFNPDNLVAHASYAFNSYWQKSKLAGGTCSFDGTALLINSDPSFLQCQFLLS